MVFRAACFKGIPALFVHSVSLYAIVYSFGKEFLRGRRM